MIRLNSCALAPLFFFRVKTYPDQMTFRDWLKDTKQRYREQSASEATKESARDFYVGGLRNLGQRVNYGDSIWDEDWDVLLILDACRYDLFEETYGGAEFMDSLSSRYSVASHSIEFMQKTFSDRWEGELEDTIYVCGNPFSADYVNANQFQQVEEVWRYGWDNQKGIIPPEPLSDVGIRLHRQNDPERMIIHYMQPHCPYIQPDSEDIDGSGISEADRWGDWGTGNEFDMLREGELSFEEHWDLYEANLQYVVEQVRETVLRSIDAEQVVITSDHGNNFGRFGIYGHPKEVPLPGLKRVPWAVTSATDDGEYTPSFEPASENVEDRDEMLRNLGYL